MTAEKAAATVSGPERSQRDLVNAINATESGLAYAAISELFCASVAKDPSATAVVDTRDTLDRRMLLGAVRDLERRLRALGVRGGDRVLMCADPGWEQLAGLLAITAVGAACVPVPPEAAQTVRWAAVTEFGAKAVVTQWWQEGRIFWPDALPALSVELKAAESAVHAAPDPDRIAVLIPDGEGGRLALDHRDLVAAVLDAGARLGMGPGDRVLVTASAGTGLGLQQMLTVALTGATAIFPKDMDLNNPAALLAQGDGATVWMTTPTMSALALDAVAAGRALVPPSLRAVVLAGERLGGGLVAGLRSVAAPGLAIAYATPAVPNGPWVLWRDAAEDAVAKGGVPLGRPMADQRVHILSTTAEPCPVWATGRVHIGGLAARPGDRTEGRAAPILHPETGEPLLATPLFARLLPEAVLELMGNAQAQVSVHGRALHLQGVDIALANHDAVLLAAAVPAPESEDCVAHVRLRTGASAGPEDLREHLRRKVSPYLLPAAVEVTTELPLTEDGRIDQAALRAKPFAPAVLDVSSAPRADAEDEELTRRVTAIACRQFGVSHIEPNINMMDIGATSYQLVRLATVLEEELGLRVDVEELLRFPSVAVIVSCHLSATAGTGPAAAAPPAARPPAPVPPVPAPDTPLTGLVARQAFKDTHRGIRHDLDDRPAVSWPAPVPEPVVMRRSVRTFDARPMELGGLASLLASLRAGRLNGERKYRYPSAGGAYPVQVYLLAAPGRVAGLPGGAYYYHPERDGLILLDPAAALPASAHADVNRAIYRESAFSLYLIARMIAITPLYGDLSRDFSVFEAGAITQLLGQSAAECGLGLCSAGTMADPAALDALFALSDDDSFLHALFGGVPYAGNGR